MSDDLSLARVTFEEKWPRQHLQQKHLSAVRGETVSAADFGRFSHALDQIAANLVSSFNSSDWDAGSYTILPHSFRERANKVLLKWKKSSQLKVRGAKLDVVSQEGSLDSEMMDYSQLFRLIGSHFGFGMKQFSSTSENLNCRGVGFYSWNGIRTEIFLGLLLFYGLFQFL